MRNFFFRGCIKSSQLNIKVIQFQLKITSFITNTMFHSLNEIVSCNKNLQKFFLNMKEDIRLNLKYKKNWYLHVKQIKTKQNLI